MSMNATELKDIFTYHAPKVDQPGMYEELRQKACEFAFVIAALCPESREKALAFTNLQSAVMFANAAIAIHG